MYNIRVNPNINLQTSGNNGCQCRLISSNKCPLWQGMLTMAVCLCGSWGVNGKFPLKFALNLKLLKKVKKKKVLCSPSTHISD